MYLIFTSFILASFDKNINSNICQPKENSNSSLVIHYHLPGPNKKSDHQSHPSHLKERTD